MGWIDVAIPGSIGLLLILASGVFAKATGDAEKNAKTASKVRLGGILLLVAAGIYLFIKLAAPR